MAVFKKRVRLPDRALTNLDLMKYAKQLGIRNFRGVFMRDALPRSGPRKNETGILNLADEADLGSHWVAWKKDGNKVFYFDSFGNLQPPSDLVTYFGSGKTIEYNHKRYQDFNSYNCGHLCLQFLSGQL